MLTRKEYEEAQVKAMKLYERGGIVLTVQEKKTIEVADFGLSDLKHFGLEIVVYVNTEKVCAKELAMFPWQTCPEHLHPTIYGKSGKEDTLRCRWGTVYLYVPDGRTAKPYAILPKGSEKYFTVWHEVVLKPGYQYTLYPDTLHWFQSGNEGAVVSEFSTRSTDEQDVFTDPRIARMTKIVDA